MTASSPLRRLERASSTALVALALAGAGVLALLSLRWPLVHDLPILLYDGFLMQELGRVPYRDFVEVNAPGTMLLHAFLHGLTGGDSLLLRLVDLAVLAGVWVSTTLALGGHGRRAGLLASACFTLAYLAGGPVQALQREYLCVLPLSVSAALVFRAGGSPRSQSLRVAAAGLLAGAAVTVKPPLVLCWAPLVAFALWQRPGDGAQSSARARAEAALAFVLGLAVVPGLVLAWMWRVGALDAYLDLARNYYPLYLQLDGNAVVRQSGLLLTLRRYAFDTLALVPQYPFVVLSFLGLGFAWTYRGRPLFAQCLAAAGVALCGLLYVAVAGKFWAYHGFPFFYGLSLLAGLGQSRGLASSGAEVLWRNFVLAAALVIGLPLGRILSEYWQWRAGRSFVVKEGRVDLIEDYLLRHTRPSETVMPLDVTTGAVHALYRNRRPLYGRFVYDQFFYHHVDHPYIQRLRRELLAEFGREGPDVVVRPDDTWVRTPSFPELDAVLANDYDLVLHENDVSIFRRRPR